MRKSYLGLIGLFFILSCNQSDTPTESGTTAATTPENKPPAQAEITDPKYTEMGKKGLELLNKGNIDEWMNSFADNAVYLWSSGDSLTGKAAIAAYWKNRRGNVIDSINFINDVWLPVKVNTPQRGPDLVGVWLLSWYQSEVKYKNGKKLWIGIHTLQHFDANDKIDRVIQYLDRAPIMAAGVK